MGLFRMEFDNLEVQSEYLRCIKSIGTEDPFADERRIGIHDVLAAHFLIADYFYTAGKGMGGIGPRDMNILNSAVHRQYVGFKGKMKWERNIEICATVFFGLIKDHPFYDANKRTAFLCLLFHLQKFSQVPTLTPKQLENFTVEIADNKIERRSKYKEIKKTSLDPEIEYIAHFLKSRVRNVDKQYYAVTFRDLKRILNGFGFDLQNPHHNRIDIVRIEERRKVFGIIGPKEKVFAKVGRIGFPNWSRKVSKSDIKLARKCTFLLPEFGIDSATFFKKADPIRCLIAGFNVQLERLANR